MTQGKTKDPSGEREMLVGSASEPDQGLGIRMKKRRSPARRVALGALALVLVIGVSGWLLGPRIAASLAERTYPVQVRGMPATLIVEDVHLGWSGPQRVGRLRVEDASGATLADLSVEATAGLLGAYRSRDLGEVTLRGSIDMNEDQLGALLPSGGPGAGTDAEAPAPTLASGRPIGGLDQLELYLPRGWRGIIKTDSLDVRYAGSALADDRTIEIEGLDLWARYDGRSEAELRLDAQSPPISAALEATSLARNDGLVELDRAKVDLDVSARVPGWIVESLTRATLGGPGAMSEARAVGTDDASVEAHLQLRDGRVKLSEGSDGVRATLPLPASLAGRFEGGPRQVQWIERPAARLTVENLDIPIVGASSATWSSGALEMRLESSVGSVFAAYDLDAPPERIELNPGVLTIASEDLSKGVRLGGTWEMAVGQRAPARIELEGTSGPLITPSGSFVAEVPAGIEVSIRVENAPTSLLEPWANRQGLTLEQWLGGNVHSRLTVRTTRGEDGNEPLGAEIEFEGNAPFADWLMVARASQSEVVFPGNDAIRVRADNIGPLVRLLTLESGLVFEGSGLVLASASDLRVPMVGGVPDPFAATGRLSMDLGDLVIASGAGPEPVTLRSVWTEAQLNGRAPISLSLNHRLRLGLDDVLASGALEVSGLFPEEGEELGSLDLSALSVEGSVRVEDVPTRLAGDRAPQWRDALTTLVGPDLDLTLDFEESGSSIARASVRATSDHELSIGALIDVEGPRQWRVDGATASFRATPAVAREVLGALENESLSGVSLVEGSRFELEIEPFALARSDDESADGGRWSLAPIEMELRAIDDVVAQRQDPAGDEAPVILAARDLIASAVLDVQAGVGGTIATSTALFSREAGAEQSIGSVTASLRSQGSNGWGVTQATLITTSPRSLDRLAGAGGMLEEMLGSRAEIRVVPQGEGFERLALTIDSEHTRAGVKLAMLEDRLAIEEPTTINTRLSPALVQRLAGDESPSARAQLSAPAPLEIAVQSLTIGRGARAPLDPEVFGLETTISAPALTLVSARDEAIEFQSLTVGLESTSEPGAIDVSLATGGLTTGEDSAPGPQATLRVHGLSDARGDLNARAPRVTGTIRGGAPTALLDNATTTRGLLLDLLGPTIDVEIDATDLSASSGHVTTVARTAFVEATLAGNPGPVAFRADRPAVVTLSRVTPEVSARLFERLMPLIDSIEKTTEDQPATVRAQGLVIPLDGDLSRLTGDLLVSLGTVRFQSSGLVAQLLEATQNRVAGEIGRRVEPFEVQIRRGIATYADTTIPMGEFSIESRGTIDLVRDELDLVLFIPLFALADEVAESLGSAPGLDRLTMIPFRVRGPSTEAKVAFAPDLLPQSLIPGFIEQGAEEVGGETGELIREAGKILEGIGRGLSGKNKKKRDQQEQDDGGG